MHPKAWRTAFQNEKNGRWWQLKDFFKNFTAIPGEIIQFDEHIFQMGWFNHQLEKLAVGHGIPTGWCRNLNKKSWFALRLPGPSSLGANRVSIHHPLGFNWHPLEGAGMCVYFLFFYRRVCFRLKGCFWNSLKGWWVIFLFKEKLTKRKQLCCT